MASSHIEEFEDGKVKYDLFDIETGQTFNVLVDRSEVNSLDNDHNKRWRLLKKLKEGNVCAASSWLDVEVSQVVTDHGSVWEPCQTKAKKPGKAGVTWGDDNTRKFLNAALPHRVQLRQYRVSQEVFENIAKTLKDENNLSYNHGELRKKVKTLKQTYGEAKQGKHKGERWEHYWLMYYLYDEDLGLSTSMALENHMKRKSLLPPASSLSHKVPIAQDVATFSLTPLLSSTLQSFTGDVPNSTETIETLSPVVPINDGPPDGIAVGSDWDDKLDDIVVEDNLEVEKNNTFFELRSPSKKKAKTPSAAVGIRNSPSTTPKRRKPRKGALMWSPDHVVDFLTECKDKKHLILKENVDPNVWKNMSTKLNMTDPGSWQLCRDKFTQMNRYFLDTILPGKGYLGGFIWAYYAEFCDIYDLPKDYYQVMDDSNAVDDENEEADENGNVTGKAKWDPDRVNLLLDVYKTKKHHFESPSFLKHDNVYGLISLQMKEFGIKISGKQCRSKMDDLRFEYRQEFDRASKTGAAPSTWPFYDKMNELDGGKPNMVAPVKIAVGRGLIFTEAGVENNNDNSANNSGTRTRPAPAQGVKKNKAPKAPIYRSSKPQQLNERSVEARERLANAVDRLSVNIETSGGQRMALLNRLESKIDKLLKLDN